MARHMPRLLALPLLLTLLVACAAPSANTSVQSPIAVANLAESSNLDVAAQAPIVPAPAVQAPVSRIMVQQEEPTTTPTQPILVGRATPTAQVEPDREATPTPRPAGTPPRVGLQVGHLRSHELPDELARLRTSTGARWGNITEAELNLDIALRVQPLLEARGIVVDILPATVPPSYDADAFIAIHADGNASGRPRGWKLATPWRASLASRALMAAVQGSYGPATGLPYDANGVTVNMRGYYAFSYNRYEHAIARTTPAIIVELGYMTNALDRDVMFGRPDDVARGIADGIIAYFDQRDPNDGAALLPPEFPAMRAIDEGAELRAAPRENARLIVRVTPEMRVSPFQLENGWYEVFVRYDNQRSIGFIREDQLTPINAEPELPPSTNP